MPRYRRRRRRPLPLPTGFRAQWNSIHLLDGLVQFEVRGVQQGLLLIRIKGTVRRLENLNLVKVPSVGCGPPARMLWGLSQASRLGVRPAYRTFFNGKSSTAAAARPVEHHMQVRGKHDSVGACPLPGCGG